MIINPLFDIDWYKSDHGAQYPEKTELVYSNMTARSAKHFQSLSGYDDHISVIGVESFLVDFIDRWDQFFFNQDVEMLIEDYKAQVNASLGRDVNYDQIRELHKLGYMPLEFRALPEGTRCPIGVPFLVVWNTLPEFYWLTNRIETYMSAELWKPITTATIAYEYKAILTEYADLTQSNVDLGAFSLVDIQAHDFSYRGMSGHEDAARSGIGHLSCFRGTDTVPAIRYVAQHYDGSLDDGLSVAATEHSVMAMGSKAGELETIRRLIKTIYHDGIVSVVSDTWDFWNVITKTAKTLKDEIMARDGKLVFRPDSGDPADIICGDPNAKEGSNEYKGAVELLYELFPGPDTPNGYKTLDPHVGLIYGDSITLERAQDICERLYDKGFASTNVVFGIGSYTYQMITRDTFGMAMKATAGIIDGEVVEIFKDPITDSGVKKSAKGFLRVEEDSDLLDELVLVQSVENIDDTGLLVPLMRDGQFVTERSTWKEIRERLAI